MPGDGPARLLDLRERCGASGRMQLRDPPAEVGRAAAQAAVMTAEPELPILEPEPIDLDRLLGEKRPRAERTRMPAEPTRCACGKDGTPEAHGYNPQTGHRALTCNEVQEIAARVEADRTPRQRRLPRLFRRGS